ncbi:hypothetical protein CLAFUW4_13113 [Fulvia fulva]|uniref:Uncharacterized protein n=1 Tax=Passalora fulva TaxID=5499 RepID=A0A9Q8UVG9_PASFU|nr:uncharacterized protein CLAFUR5_12972 [Fulvia fulva]KAK4611540.1 hypothetical protein CLAFUR4_13117 [Fulvia fulva]KAK4613114.1 hypothetical protein CLAFUR0_13122 [Fulvia fulva]UJO23890.1 hypothetical protein CLAFUR5_12972 [Fulvia fulva]WPV21370.1 hypothetical protein CLAFUW4_13113 [Fulvia fulva]WPV36595.1 hypothetical protein CLAFUW7_13121 [Fulvia fulva]
MTFHLATSTSHQANSESKVPSPTPTSLNMTQPAQTTASFLELPGELRNKVYNLHLNDLAPLIGGSWLSVENSTFLIASSDLNLLLASRQINTELGPLFWQHFDIYFKRCVFLHVKSARSISMAWQRHADREFLPGMGLLYSDDRSIGLRLDRGGGHLFRSRKGHSRGLPLVEALERSGASYDLGDLMPFHGSALSGDEKADATVYVKKGGELHRLRIWTYGVEVGAGVGVDGPLWALDWGL